MNDKNRVSKWMLLAIIAIGSGLIPILITGYELVTTDKESVVFLENYPPIIANLILTYYLLLFAVGIVWLIKQVKSILILKNDGTKTELLHLQSQVNPHFFFNTLNNLYGLVGTDAKKAQELILKLSDMMRYSIYEGKKDHVLLKDEMAYLKQYVELHEMRYNKKIEITFSDNIQANHKVAPLLFIILLENAFKHGVENLRKNAFVHTKLHSSANEVHFEVENNFDPEVSDTAGIGLKNLKRRLDLIYPNQHKLTLDKGEESYKAVLTLNV